MDEKVQEVARPEWLEPSLKSAQDSLRLIQQGLWPRPLVGWSIVVTCRRLLRCVYGDDLTAANAIRELVLKDVAEQQRWDALTPEQQEKEIADIEVNG